MSLYVWQLRSCSWMDFWFDSNYCWEVLRTLRFFVIRDVYFQGVLFYIFCEYILRPFPTSVLSRGVLDLCGLRMHDIVETSWCIECEHWQQDCLRQRLHTEKSEYGVRNRSVEGNYSIVIILLLSTCVTISDTVCVFQCWCTMSVFVSTYLVYIDTMYILYSIYFLYYDIHSSVSSVCTFRIGGDWYMSCSRSFLSPSPFFSPQLWHCQLAWRSATTIAELGALRRISTDLEPPRSAEWAMKKGPL